MLVMCQITKSPKELIYWFFQNWQDSENGCTDINVEKFNNDMSSLFKF